jgi:hypothetical protein
MYFIAGYRVQGRVFWQTQLPVGRISSLRRPEIRPEVKRATSGREIAQPLYTTQIGMYSRVIFAKKVQMWISLLVKQNLARGLKPERHKRLEDWT